MQIEIILLGKSAMLMHNPQMVDSECEYTRAIKALTSKRKKTDEDLKEIEKLEWHGGLYTTKFGEGLRVSQPSSKIHKCLVNTARILKLGKGIERSLIMNEQHAPLIYEGSEKVKDGEKEIERLSKSPAFTSRLSVGINGKKRVMRIRPEFLPWALVMGAMFITSAGVSFQELQHIVELAGDAERIGDNRVNGYGAFYGHARSLEDADPIERNLGVIRNFFKTLEKGW